MILLDTGFLIGGLVRGTVQDVKLRRWLRAGEELAMCTIAWAEFLCGPLAESDLSVAKRLVTTRQPFSDEDAGLAATLFNASGRRRGTFVDCMIAAAAIHADAPLATTNLADFKPFTAHGLELV